MIRTAASPAISILVAVHDEERYLPAAFQSILEQTMDLRLLELLLVDDGSRDRSGELAEGYARRYPNVRAFQYPEASGGAGRPWNRGLAEAQAPYIMILGADDVFMPDACEVLHEAIVSKGCDVVSGSYLQTGGAVSFVPSAFAGLFPEPFFCERIEDCPAFLALPPALGTRIYRRAFLDEAAIRFPEGIIAQDAVFATDVLLHARGIGQIPETVYEYRVRDDPSNPSVSQRLTGKYFEDFSASRRAIVRSYEKHPELDYLRMRYRIDLDFILTAMARSFARSGGLPAEERAAAFEALRWFCALRGKADLGELHPTKSAIAALIADGARAEAGELLGLVAEFDRLAEARRNG